MQISDYLSRIGLEAVLPPTLDSLHILQDAHMRHVPFENLDVVLGRPLDISPASLFEKIVTRKRGGYCFELNTLYGALLSACGFDPVPMMARVWLRDPAETPPRTHLVNRVKIDDQYWISDVGFGGRAARVPMLIADEYEVDDGDGYIHILRDMTFGYRIIRYVNGAWVDQYTVEIEEAHLSDILCGNHWTETHPESHFRHGIGVGLFTEEGRTSFYEGMLTHRGKDTVSRPITGLEETLGVLVTEFGINLKLTDAERARLESVLP